MIQPKTPEATPISKEVTILLPTLNEEEAIGRALADIPVQDLREAGYVVTVLVVDGESTDKTVAIASEKGARVVVTARGYGRQYRLGFAEAPGDIIVTADSDGSYPLEDILPLIQQLEHDHLDFITTNRFADMEPGSMHPLNRIGNFILTFLINHLFKLHLKDSQSGMWVIRKSALSRMRLTAEGMSLSGEIKIVAFESVNAREIDSGYKKRLGTVKLKRFRDGWGILIHLYKMKWERIIR